ncbi:MAG: 4'-phosphopantetheinyl transferase superfamily protein [Ruminococcus sp.]|nr:4'-phosphopantetheinyl transferase superfamily protein [Ruminococcus sp.]
MYKLYVFDRLEEISDDFVQKSLEVLPEERRRKAVRYKFQKDRKLSVVSGLLLAYALRINYKMNIPEIMHGEYGKPYFPQYHDIFFNISHCNKGCALVVSDRKIGVDIQDYGYFSWDIARHVCSENEMDILRHSEEKDRLFTKFWAIKESYVKMTGEGIRDLKLIDSTAINNYFYENQKYIISVCHE